jgi:hypothetical protein
MRKPQGSATEFNRQLNHELQFPPISAEVAAAAKAGGISGLAAIRDRAQRAWLGRGTSELSDLFLAPDSVDQIRAIAARAAETPGGDAMLRQTLQAPSEMKSRDRPFNPGCAAPGDNPLGTLLANPWTDDPVESYRSRHCNETIFALWGVA